MKLWRGPYSLLCWALAGSFTLFALGARSANSSKQESDSVLFLVMDPLSKELACACVKGYGQRDYRRVAARLEKAIHQKISIEFSDDLVDSLASAGPSRPVIVVGDRSLISAGAKKAGRRFEPICELTDTNGSTRIPAIFVVRRNDSANSLQDIRGRQAFFGVSEADEKNGAALAALSQAGVESSIKPERRSSYSDAALDLLDSKAEPAPVAIIPGYALPLLEGCGTMRPGTLKVIGKTEAVPFITVFVSDSLPPSAKQKVLGCLMAINKEPKLLKAIESRDGFKLSNEQHAGGKAHTVPNASTAADWPDWRGSNRDGHVRQLPSRLASAARIVWKKATPEGGLAGLSVSQNRLIVAERDLADEQDFYRCLHAETGELLWAANFPAKGKLDYGQAPRATPVIHGGKVYVLGAFGGLRCLRLSDGKLIWQRNLPKEFNARLPTWGMCSTPLLVNDLLIVNPGAANASLVALDADTGKTRWTSPGQPAAYSSFVLADYGGKRQTIGYDQFSLGGWDLRTGQRLWRLTPVHPGDFNVPTPILVQEGIILSTENNGTRFYSFDSTGRLEAKSAAECPLLAPTTMTPVVTRNRLFGVQSGLFCLDVKNGLQVLWRTEDEALGEHASLFADDSRVLIMTMNGELLLLDATSDKCAIVSKLKIFESDAEVYSHPALVGSRLYARNGNTLLCVDIAPQRTDS